MSNFNNSKKIGKKGESATINYYTWQGLNVIDVSENKDFQKMDIDLIVDDEYIEVKTQSSIANNNTITLELEVNYDDFLINQGWFNTTEANKLVFYDKNSNTAYEIDTKELRDIYDKYKNDVSIYYFDEDYKTSKLAFMDIDFVKSKSQTLNVLDYNLIV